MRTRTWRTYGFVAFALMVLLMSWESQWNNPALAVGGIPEESIRLRILANSDNATDQWIKRKVRDAIVERMNEWVDEPGSIDQARETVQANLGEIERVVGDVLRQHGFDYDYQVEFGNVPFPAKLYGNKLYPAGDYEAVRVTIGAGEGQNWWCVLFPPLCFVDAANGEAVADDGDDAELKQTALAADAQEEPKVRFFLWDLLAGIIDFIKGLF